VGISCIGDAALGAEVTYRRVHVDAQYVRNGGRGRSANSKMQISENDHADDLEIEISPSSKEARSSVLVGEQVGNGDRWEEIFEVHPQQVLACGMNRGVLENRLALLIRHCGRMHGKIL